MAPQVSINCLVFAYTVHVLASLMFANIVHDQHFPKNLKTREENIQMKIWEADIFFCIVTCFCVKQSDYVSVVAYMEADLNTSLWSVVRKGRGLNDWRSPTYATKEGPLTRKSIYDILFKNYKVKIKMM